MTDQTEQHLEPNPTEGPFQTPTAQVTDPNVPVTSSSVPAKEAVQVGQQDADPTVGPFVSPGAEDRQDTHEASQPEHHDDEGQPLPGHENDSEIAHTIGAPDAAKQLAPTEAQQGASRPAQPVQVDGRNRRSDADAIEGGFVHIVEGEHAGRFGAFLHVLERDVDGYPSRIMVRTRDEFNELLAVAYRDVRQAHTNGGR